MKHYLNTARNAAIKAGKILKANVYKTKKLHYKSNIDLVTDTDKKSEKLIIDFILSQYPEHSILAEEEGVINNTNTEFKWIIDPLDGTTNFAKGFPFFCISIALEINNKVVLGLIYDPIHEELFHSISGKGAYLNNKKISVSKTRSLNKAVLSTGFPYDLWSNPDLHFLFFEEFSLNALAVRRAGSAALDLSYVACGRFDGFWEAKLNPWDIAAGQLLVKEAGGKLSDYSGNQFDIYGNEIVAGNAYILNKMLSILNKVKR